MVQALDPILQSARYLVFAALALAVAILGGALIFQYVWGYAPCHLCLQQREPWWTLIGLTVVTLGLPQVWSKVPGRALIGLLAIGTVLALYSSGLATYHAGIEWKLWAGPPDCTGTGATLGTDFGHLTSANVIRCDEAAWRMFGVSMAGYNVLASLAAAALCALAGFRLFQIERLTRLLMPGLKTLNVPAKEPQK